MLPAWRIAVHVFISAAIAIGAGYRFEVKERIQEWITEKTREQLGGFAEWESLWAAWG